MRLESASPLLKLPGVTPVVLQSPDGHHRLTVNVDGIDPPQYQRVSDLMARKLRRESRTYVAVAQAMRMALRLCPQANPADLWQHLIYHQFRTRFARTDQSWKRVSGQALEHTIMSIYNQRLRPHRIRLRPGTRKDAQALGLTEKGLGSSKTDLVLERLPGPDSDAAPVIFGVIHVKASIAERLTDDAPASEHLIENGYWSVVATMDSKMFPPPHGDGIVNGELGARPLANPGNRRVRDSDKRRYFEVAGQFSGCYSFNLRTPPSPARTPSGSRIQTLSFCGDQPDALVRDILDAWHRFEQTHAP